jgi:hypothetical protein
LKGLLGIAAKGSTVYLHFTERDPQNKVSNLFYKYTWDGNTLINPIQVKEIHEVDCIGGVMVTDAKKGTVVYAIMGDLNNRKGVLQNHPNGTADDDTSVIFALKSKNPHDYYAI